MKSQFVKNMINEIPEDIKLFSSIYTELTLKINEALKSQGLSQKDLAERLEKKPSEVSKWLNGEHNFTLRSLCKLQCELGIELIKIPREEIFEELVIEKYTSHESLKWESKVPKKSQCKVIPLSVSYNKQFNAIVNY